MYLYKIVFFKKENKSIEIESIKKIKNKYWLMDIDRYLINLLDYKEIGKKRERGKGRKEERRREEGVYVYCFFSFGYNCFFRIEEVIVDVLEFFKVILYAVKMMLIMGM